VVQGLAAEGEQQEELPKVTAARGGAAAASEDRRPEGSDGRPKIGGARPSEDRWHVEEGQAMLGPWRLVARECWWRRRRAGPWCPAACRHEWRQRRAGLQWRRCPDTSCSRGGPGGGMKVAGYSAAPTEGAQARALGAVQCDRVGRRLGGWAQGGGWERWQRAAGMEIRAFERVGEGQVACKREKSLHGQLKYLTISMGLGFSAAKEKNH
jgi:hypothetical protein